MSLDRENRLRMAVKREYVNLSDINHAASDILIASMAVFCDSNSAIDYGCAEYV